MNDVSASPCRTQHMPYRLLTASLMASGADYRIVPLPTISTGKAAPVDQVNLFGYKWSLFRYSVNQAHYDDMK